MGSAKLVQVRGAVPCGLNGAVSLTWCELDGAGEWYRIRDLDAATGHGLARVLHQMSTYVGQQTSLGYAEALAVSNRGGSLQQQREAATAAIRPHSTALFNMIKNGPYA